jgi:serine/threonine-protein kinase
MSAATPKPTTDLNLLYGMLALQMGFVHRDGLLAAMRAWVFAKERPLGELLQEQQALTPQQRQVLDAVVLEHLKAHGGDAQRSLTSAAHPSALPADLHKVGDPDLDASLAATASTQLATGHATTAEVPVEEGLRYQVLRPHARGGLGIVSVARDRELGREVALKEIDADHSQNEGSRSRFVREAEITGGLEHPGIVPVYGLGRHPDGRPYYAMRFIRGESLQDAVRKLHSGDRTYTLRRLLTRLVAVCNAVAYAHSRGVIHRDLKPANVMLGPYGETLVVDWGLAKAIGRQASGEEQSGEATLLPSSGDGSATQAGSALGTPAYMSPEQARGEVDSLGPVTDVYGLGTTLYAVLTGQAPIHGHSAAEMVEKVRLGSWTPPRQVAPATPVALEAICKKAMALDPARRYPSVVELAADLERWLADEPVLAYSEPLRVRAGRWVRRHRTSVATAMGVLVVTVISLVAFAAVQAESATRLAQKNRELEAANARITQAQELLANRNEALEQANTRLAAARDSAERRVDLAVGAIESFRSTVDGNLDVKNRPENEALRKAMLQAPLAFYQKLRDDLRGRDDTSPAAQAKLADAYYQLATLDRDIGSQAEALKAYSEAVTILETLLQSDDSPRHGELRDQLARAVGDRGALESQSKVKPAEALQSLRRSRELREGALAEKPSDIAARVELAGILDDLARVEAHKGDVDAALATLKSSLSVLDEAQRLDPSRVRTKLLMARTHLQVGDALRKHRSRLAEALASAQTALQIVEPLAKAQPGDLESQTQLSSAYDTLGKLHEAKGEYDKALEVYKKQVAAVDEMIRSQPAFTRYKLERVYALSNVGSALYRMGRNAEGLENTEKARDLAQTLARDNPTSLQFKKALSTMWSRLATPLYALGRVADAVTVVESAAAIQEEILQSDPEDVGTRQSVAGSYYNSGVLNFTLGKLDAALAAYDKALRLREKLAHDQPDDPSFALDVASTLGNIANVHHVRHHYAEAKKPHQQAVDILQKLAAAHPDNAEYVNYLLRARQNLAADLLELGQTKEALEFLRAAQEPSERMAREHPDVPQYRHDLADGLANIALALRKAGQLDEALATYQRALDIREKLFKDNPGTPEYRSLLADLFLNRAEAELERKRPAEAMKSFRRAEELQAEVSKPTVDQIYNLACCQARLAAAASLANSGLTADQVRADSDKAMATLRRAVDAGFRDAAGMSKDTDLESLRKRDDFQALVREVETKATKYR